MMVVTRRGLGAMTVVSVVTRGCGFNVKKRVMGMDLLVEAALKIGMKIGKHLDK